MGETKSKADDYTKIFNNRAQDTSNIIKWELSKVVLLLNLISFSLATMISGNTPASNTSFQPLPCGTRIENDIQSSQRRLDTSELANSTLHARNKISEGEDARSPQEQHRKSEPLTSASEISSNLSLKGCNHDRAVSSDSTTEGLNLLRSGTYVDSTSNSPVKPNESTKVEEVTSRHNENMNQTEKKAEAKTRYSVKVEVSAPPSFSPKKKDYQPNPCKKSVIQKKSTLSYQPSRPDPSTLNGHSHLIASILPSAFPERMAFRTLALYSTIRTLSIDLRLSPFTPNAFLRALSLPTHSQLVGDIHASILRLLFAHHDLGVYHYRGDGLSKLKLPPKKENDGISEYIARRGTLHPKAGENLLYLDHLTWPLYLLDFIQIVEVDDEEEMESPLLDGGADLDEFFQSKQSELVKSQIKRSIQMQIPQTSIPPKKKPRSEYQNSKENQYFSPPLHLKDGQTDLNQIKIGDDQNLKKFTQSPSIDYHVLPTGPNLYQPYQQSMHQYQGIGQYQNPLQYYPHSYGPHSYGPSINQYPYFRRPYPHRYPTYQGQGLGEFHPSTNIAVDEQTTTLSDKKDESINVDSNHVVHEQATNDLTSSEKKYDSINTNSSHQSERIVRVDSKILDFEQSQNQEVEMHNTNFGDKQEQQMSEVSSSATSQQPMYQQGDQQKKRKCLALNCEIVTSRESDVKDDEDSKEYTSVFDSVETYLLRKNPIPSIIKSPRKGNLDKDHCTSSDTEDGSDHDECDDNVSERNQSERTAVQNPTKSAILQNFEQGKPYFKLPIATKVEILEYLVDELLDIELVKQQLDGRKNLNHSQPTSYGKLPTPQELCELVNNDECKVCGLEGDLLCCDGCVASYHRECVDVQLSNIMSTDKWFCHECKIVDGCTFGPLDGGHKASLDWFSIDDLRQEEKPNENHVLAKWEHKLFSDIFENVQFLIIHGYVFARHTETKAKATVDLNSFVSYNKHVASSSLHLKVEDKSLKTLSYGTSSMVPLNQLELYIFLVALGPSRCTEWPWTQIPFNPDKLDYDWKRLGYDYSYFDYEKMLRLKKSKQQYYDFVQKADTFNPYTYKNSYERSSIHRLIELKMGKRKLKLNTKVLNMDNSLRYQLSRDWTGDNRLVQSLLSDDCYDPLSPIREYMTNLEKQLLRSTLLSEFWGLRSKSRDLHWWSNRVKNCKSIKVLCKLLITLIDETNSRAFITEWFILPGMSNDDLNTPKSDAPRNYTDLKTEWSEKEEKLRRNLERCHDSDLLTLIGHTSKASNRKGRKAQKDLRVFKDKKSNELEVKVESGLSGKSSRKARMTNTEENKYRRKSDRHHSIMNPTTCSTDELITDKLYNLEKQCSDIDAMENHWPIAGRKLFEPCGSLPKPVVKWLGRNAGIKHAPYVRYTDKFEIGLPAASHIWRQKTLKSTTFEEIIYQIRVLDSYFNKNVSFSMQLISMKQIVSYA